MIWKKLPQLERFEAHLPDGRLIMIERQKNFGLAPGLQWAIRMLLIPVIVLTLVLLGPSIPLIMFAGFWSFIPALLVVIFSVAIAQDHLLDWMRNHAGEPNEYEVIGMDCSTDEMLDLAHKFVEMRFAEGTVH
ncbi:MAG: hypothetical protein AAFQ12_10940 [Pseudomonadota bacterium]